MKYFIPAWHKQYDDWSINIPSIENYDAAEYMTVLKKVWRKNWSDNYRLSASIVE